MPFVPAKTTNRYKTFSTGWWLGTGTKWTIQHPWETPTGTDSSVLSRFICCSWSPSPDAFSSSILSFSLPISIALPPLTLLLYAYLFLILPAGARPAHGLASANTGRGSHQDTGTGAGMRAIVAVWHCSEPVGVACKDAHVGGPSAST